ncbi:MAG TPA: hydrogenase expression/formation C-terminal domain-containing protein [Steroidobacteraceae bacterium]
MEMNSSSASEALRSIGVAVERSSGNIEPLLHQVRHALVELLHEGRGAVIDLQSIPLAPGEEDRILQALGRGEIQAQLSVFGASEILETGFPGVWVVTHRDDRGVVQARFIEITRVPEILCSQSADIAAGLERLCASLGSATVTDEGGQ